MKFGMKLIGACLATFISLSASAGGHVTTVIDFEAQGQAGKSVDLYQHPIDGYSIGYGSYVKDLSGTAHGPAYSGQYAAFSNALWFYREDEGLFSVQTIRLKSWSGNHTAHISGGLYYDQTMPVTIVNLSDTSWTEVVLDFSKVTYFAVVADGADLLYDNIVITSVPEPSTYAMLLAGFGLVAGAARRKRRSAPSNTQ